jgi:hypothetical protein
MLDRDGKNQLSLLAAWRAGRPEFFFFLLKVWEFEGVRTTTLLPRPRRQSERQPAARPGSFAV